MTECIVESYEYRCVELEPMTSVCRISVKSGDRQDLPQALNLCIAAYCA